MVFKFESHKEQQQLLQRERTQFCVNTSVEAERQTDELGIKTVDP